MAETTVAICQCQAIVTDEIRLCAICHRYWKGKQEFTSVSKVKKTLLPEDYSGIDPIILECARLRGVFVDTYFSEYLTDPSNTVSPEHVRELIERHFPVEGEKHALDTVTRINRVLDWWHGSKFKFKAAQEIVYSELDRIAGTLDLRLEGMILDVKCVSQLQPNYRLQLGAYRHYHRESAQRVGILHVTKDKVKLIEYPGDRSEDQWCAAVNWYLTRQELQ